MPPDGIRTAAQREVDFGKSPSHGQSAFAASGAYNCKEASTIGGAAVIVGLKYLTDQAVTYAPRPPC